MYNCVFITGIGTDVGKTLASAIVCKALSWDYWKPVQTGSLESTDSIFIKKLKDIKTHPEAYCLQAPLSPHAAAEIENIDIQLKNISLPAYENGIVIEGAGGLMVPLNREDLLIDLISHLQVPVLLVSKNYLGSINHTLLSIEALQKRNITIAGILFNGEPTPASEEVILKISKAPNLGRIPLTESVDTSFIDKEALKLKKTLLEYGFKDTRK